MPSNIVKSFADKTGKSVGEVESLWNKAKAVASKEGEPENYQYITGILKKMLGMKEMTFEQFLKSGKPFNEFYEDVQTSSSFSSITPTNPYRKGKDDEDRTFSKED